MRFKSNKHLYFPCSANPEGQNRICDHLVLRYRKILSFLRKWLGRLFFFSLYLSILSLFTSPQLQFLKMEEALDKEEIWAQKYLYAHPIWFGSFSAFLVVTDPDYAKVLLARGGEEMMPSSCGATTTACRFPVPAWKFAARQGFMESFPCRNDLKAWRDIPPSCHALSASGTGLRGWAGTLQIWQIKIPQVFLEKLSSRCLTPARRRKLEAFFLSPYPWLLLWCHVFSASREKGAKQCCAGALIIYHTAQTLDCQYSCLCQCGHLLSYVFLVAGPNSVVLLGNTDEFCRDATDSASYPTKSENPEGAFRCKPVGWCYWNTILFSLSWWFFYRSQG